MEPTNMHSQRRDSPGVLSSALQRFQNLIAAIHLHNAVQHPRVERVDADAKQLHTRPSDLHTEQSVADPKLRGGVCWHDHEDPHLHVPQPLWATLVGRLGNVVKHLYKVGHQPDQRAVSGQSSQPVEPCKSGKSDCHTCTRHPERSCNCASGECADDGDDWIRAYTKRATDYYDRIDHERNAKYVGKPFPVLRVPESGGFTCPVNGKACGSEFCEGSRCKESIARSEAGVGWSNAQATNDN